MYQVIKRDGKISEFDIAKISNAIQKAFDAVERQYHPSIIDMLALRVTSDFEPKIRHDRIQVEDIQDSVESILIQSAADYLIPLHMSEGIIDFLKIINVHHQDANGMSVLQYLLQHSFSILHKGTSIVDTAEVIIAGLIQRILKLQDIVDGDCNVVGEDLQQSLVCSAEVLHLI